MIRAATPADAALVLALARAAPALGPRLEVDWRLLAENPAMPYRFYIADEAAALLDFGRGATLCGPVADGAEMLAFLGHLGKDFVTTGGWVPPGWQARELAVMVGAAAEGRPGAKRQTTQPRCAAKPPEGAEPQRVQSARAAAGSAAEDRLGAGISGPPGPRPPLPEGFDPQPEMGEFFAVLAHSDPIPEPIQNGMYFDLCARRNHGFFDLCGVRAGGRLVSAAAVFALTGHEAYISGVETLPEHRGRGYASALVAHLAAKYAPRRVSLMCEAELVPFYQRLGFVQSPAQYVDARRPGREDAGANAEADADAGAAGLEPLQETTHAATSEESHA